MLIDLVRHDYGVFGYVVITFLLLVGPLAYLFGVDSRLDEHARNRRIAG